MYSFIGGLEKKHLCPVDYRTELREATARVDLSFYRAVLDKFGFLPDLLLHAIESQFWESGSLSIIFSHILHMLYSTAKRGNFAPISGL